jgi:sulfatase maturation enzyme AslB (radical SAM superfamily)
MSKNTFEYNGQVIEFDHHDKDVMVNATQMAKIYGKDLRIFLKTESTQFYIEAVVKYLNSQDNDTVRYHYTVEDVVNSNKKRGTFMHRLVALKFAAWLDVHFEIWVYATIENILFGSYREMEAGIRASAERTQKIKELENRMRELPDYAMLERLKLEERQAKAGRSRIINTQLRLFIDED